jgi:hypothetical protein
VNPDTAAGDTSLDSSGRTALDEVQSDGRADAELDADVDADVDVDAWAVPPSRRRRKLIVTAAVVVLAVAIVVAVVARPFGGRPATSGGVVDNASATGLATVAKQSLSAHTSVAATLGYAGTYTVANQATGSYTAVPKVGDLIEQGQSLYAVDGVPVVLLLGSGPAYRTMVQGVRGPDVAQLNADLVALGYAGSELNATSDLYTAATAAAVAKLQSHLGVQATGVLALGQVAFLPSAARITTVTASTGATAQPGAAVATATSTVRQVVVKLAAALQSQVKVDDKVTVTLPDSTTTPGVVSKVGKVAVTAQGQGSDSSPTIEVDITPTDATATGTLDQAPVQVAITTAVVDDALVVPVAALISPAGGGYAVEIANGNNPHRLVAVTTGLFDDADGLVQITASGVHAGDRVVVPAS